MKKLESLKGKKFDVRKVRGGAAGSSGTDIYEWTETPCGCPKRDLVHKDLFV